MYVDFVLQDVEVCGTTTVEITPSSTQPREWKEYGLKLYPQEDSLPDGVDKVTITILASIVGRYQFPENFYPISAVFWLHCQPNCTFTKPIKIQMEHCANSNNTTKLRFARASTFRAQKELPYTFKQLDDGRFYSQDRYGTIELNQFCGLGVVQKDSNERRYYGILFHLGQQTRLQQTIPDQIHIALTWNDPAHVTVSDV